MRTSFSRLVVMFVLLLASMSTGATALQLQAYDFMEKRPLTMRMWPTPAGPAARVAARISFKDATTRIDLSYESMKPAILFGGDVTSYVVWAVTPGGDAENLGELVTRKKTDRLQFSTSKKNFALMVTAEPYALVPAPSDLVVFTNASTTGMNGEGKTSPFEFDGLVPAARHGMDTIVHIKWDSKTALDLLQARKVIELAGQHDAATHAATIFHDAEVALRVANDRAAASPRSSEVFDMARRALALGNEAINVSRQRKEALELEAWVAEQRATAEALEQRAAEAEEATRQAQAMAEIANTQMQTLELERARMTAETTALAEEKQRLEASMGSMRAEKEELEIATREMRLEVRSVQQEKAELERLSAKFKKERDELNGRLESALSHVADTTDSARGFVVNLPDILFDVNEANLKPEAQLVLAKLAGILLIMPDQSVIIEGHTDATGSEEYNLELSEQRAAAVRELLGSQGIDPDRLDSMGFGMQRPVAANDTVDGRRKNRRVEIVISNGEQFAETTVRTDRGVAGLSE